MLAFWEDGRLWSKGHPLPLSRADRLNRLVRGRTKEKGGGGEVVLAQSKQTIETSLE